MGSIGIHLNNTLKASCKGPRKTVQVRDAQAFFCAPLKKFNSFDLPKMITNKISGSIR
jgi:hypothetical protein